MANYTPQEIEDIIKEHNEALERGEQPTLALSKKFSEVSKRTKRYGNLKRYTW